MRGISLKIKFIILALVSGAIVLAGLYFSFNTTKDFVDQKEKENAENIMAAISAEIGIEINDYEHSVLILSKLQSIKDLIEIQKKITMEDLAGEELVTEEAKYIDKIREAGEVFLTFAEENKDYFQLRYIDAEGNEVVRVDRPGRLQTAEIRDVTELQNKKDRYYFQDSINLATGEVFVSELDLNVEQGEVEVPYNPTIRFATPVFDDQGNNHGIVIINVFGDRLLNFVKLSPYPNTFFLDQDGYYLLNFQESEKEWGKYLGNDYLYPDYRETGRIKDLLRTNRFLAETFSAEHANVHQHFYYKVPYSGVDLEKYWVIAVMVDNEVFFEDFYALQTKITLQNLIIMFVVIFIFILIVNRVTKPMKFINEATEKLNLGNYDINIPIISKDEFGQLSEKINSLAKSVREKNKEQYAFISSASHQLRTPASVVRMNAELLEEKLLKIARSKKYLQHTKEIMDGNRTIISITGDLLKFIEIGENYFASNLKRIPVKKFVLEILKSSEEMIKENKLKVELNVPSNLSVKAEEARFRDILVNLISNAIDYSNEGGKIKIEAKKQKKTILFKISDTGIGIPAKEKIHLFDKFFRAENAYIKKVVGTGLGLVIAKRIIEGHGGRIKVESQENKGTTVSFTIFNE